MRRRARWVGCLVLAVCAAACGGNDDSNHNPGALYPDRANQYREDQERRIGDDIGTGQPSYAERHDPEKKPAHRCHSRRSARGAIPKTRMRASMPPARIAEP